MCVCVCVCVCARVCVYSIIVTNIANATRHRCSHVLFCYHVLISLNGKIQFFISKLSFEKLPEDSS